MSLNGKIADSNGSVDWLESIPNPDKLDYGYLDFIKNIDATIQGNATYSQLLDWGIDFPYPTKSNYVFTRNNDLSDNDDVQFVSSEHIEFAKNLKKEKGRDIWLLGGGQINTLLFNAGLIDEIILFIMPIVITDGIDLLEGIPVENKLKLIKSISYPTGAVQLHYSVFPSAQQD